jgi:hypothetical protein
MSGTKVVLIDYSSVHMENLCEISAVCAPHCASPSVYVILESVHLLCPPGTQPNNLVLFAVDLCSTTQNDTKIATYIRRFFSFSDDSFF